MKTYNPKNIILDNQFKACWAVRRKISERVTNLDFLIKKIKQLKLEKDQYINDFLCFLEDLSNETYGFQQNNHNLMNTLLKEKTNTHKRIPYDLLEDCLTRGYIPYAANVSPKKIMSNSYITNKTEKLLKVKKLEDAFLAFTRSDRKLLTKNKEGINLLIQNQEEFILLELNFHDDLMSPNEIGDIKHYFCLQLTRREFFLYNILQECLKGINKENFDNFDLLDYLYCKYIYNSALIDNFNNWLNSIEENIHIYQVQYKSYVDNILSEEASINSDLAITEAHTFIVKELIDSLNLQFINETLKINNLDELSDSEIESTNNILVTIGSDNKLCYLVQFEINSKLFDKIHFIIHNFWDEFMLHRVLLNLLLKKDSKLNNVESFKKANISSDVFNRAKFMKSAFDISVDFEKKIKKKGK